MTSEDQDDCEGCGGAFDEEEAKTISFGKLLCQPCVQEIQDRLTASLKNKNRGEEKSIVGLILERLQRRNHRSEKIALKRKLRSLADQLDHVTAFDGTEEIMVYCDEMTIQVELAFESALQHMERVRAGFQKRIEDYRSKMIAARSGKPLLDVQSSNYLSQMKDKFNQLATYWRQIFSSAVVKTGDIHMLDQRTQELKMKLALVKNGVKNNVLIGKQMRFEPNDQFYQSECQFGALILDDQQSVGDPESAPSIEIAPQLTHKRARQTIRQVLFLPNGNLVMCCREVVQIWNPDQSELLFELDGPAVNPKVIAYLKEQNWLAIGSDFSERPITIWDLNDATCLRTFTGFRSGVRSLLSISKKMLASYSNDRVIRLWDPETGKQIRCLSGYDLRSDMGLLPNGYLIFKSKQLMVLKMDDQNAVFTIQAPRDDDDWSSLVVLANGDVAYGFNEGSVMIYNLIDSSKSRTIRCFNSRVAGIQELPQRLLATVCRLKYQAEPIKIWSLDDLSMVKSISIHSQDRLSQYDGISLAYSQRESMLACAVDGKLQNFRIFDCARPHRSAKLLNKRYEIMQYLGQDSKFQTYLTLDRDEKNRKILRKALISTEKSMTPLAKLLQIDHTNMVKLTDHFSTNEQVDKTWHYFVSESLETDFTLKEYIKDEFTAQRRLEENYELRVLKWISQITDAIAHLHSRGLVHGNLNPRAVYLLNNKDKAKIELPDMSRLFGEAPSSHNVDDLRYYSPERIQAITAYQSTSEDDCWALGCILYELVTMKVAFEGTNTYKVCKAVVENPAPRINLPEYENLYTKLVDKKKSSRLDIFGAQELLLMIMSEILLDSSNIATYLTMRAEEPERKTKYKLIDTDLFENWQQETSYLDLSHNEFSSIQKDALNLSDEKRASVEKISLNYNLLAYIDRQVLKGFANLTHLNLSHNRIRHLDEKLFDDLNQLRHLDLSNNRITTAAGRLFLSLKKLEHLDLSHNRFCEIDGDVFSPSTSLRVLILSHNRIQRVWQRALERLNNLIRLRLDNNKLTRIFEPEFNSFRSTRLMTPKMTSDNCLSLEKFDLSHNRISELDYDQLKPFGNLRKLDLRSNFIRSMNRISFSSVPKLRELDLSLNNIAILDLEALNELESPEFVNLSDNLLTSVDLEDWRSDRPNELRLSLSGNEGLANEVDLCSRLDALKIKLRMNRRKCRKTQFTPPPRWKTELLEIKKAVYGEAVDQILVLDADRIAILSNSEKSIRIWSLTGGRLTAVPLRGHVGPLVQLSQRHLACRRSQDSAVSIWEIGFERQVKTLNYNNAEWLLALPDEGLACFSVDGLVNIWSPPDNERSLQLDLGEKQITIQPCVLSNGFFVTCVSGKEKSSLSKIMVWNDSDGTLVHSLKPFDSAINTCLVLSNDNLAIGLYNGYIEIIDLSDTSKSRWSEDCDSRGVRSLLELPDGHMMSSDDYGILRIWSTKDEELVYSTEERIYLNLAWARALSPYEFLVPYTRSSDGFSIYKLTIRQKPFELAGEQIHFSL